MVLAFMKRCPLIYYYYYYYQLSRDIFVKFLYITYTNSTRQLVLVNMCVCVCATLNTAVHILSPPAPHHSLIIAASQSLPQLAALIKQASSLMIKIACTAIELLSEPIKTQ